MTLAMLTAETEAGFAAALDLAIAKVTATKENISRAVDGHRKGGTK